MKRWMLIKHYWDDKMVSETCIDDKFRTIIPPEIRKKFNLDKSCRIEWFINDDGKVEVEFIKQLSIDEMIGRYSASKPIDSRQLKHDFKNNPR